jgi:hypothetical protein
MAIRGIHIKGNPERTTVGFGKDVIFNYDEEKKAYKIDVEARDGTFELNMPGVKLNATFDKSGYDLVINDGGKDVYRKSEVQSGRHDKSPIDDAKLTAYLREKPHTLDDIGEYLDWPSRYHIKKALGRVGAKSTGHGRGITWVLENLEPGKKKSGRDHISDEELKEYLQEGGPRTINEIVGHGNYNNRHTAKDHLQRIGAVCIGHARSAKWKVEDK